MLVKYKGLQASKGFHDTIFLVHIAKHGNKKGCISEKNSVSSRLINVVLKWLSALEMHEFCSSALSSHKIHAMEMRDVASKIDNTKEEEVLQHLVVNEIGHWYKP
jgi:hypothetical protein